MGTNNEGMPTADAVAEAAPPLTPEELAETPYGKIGFTGDEHLKFEDPETGDARQGTVREFFEKCPHARLLSPNVTRMIIQESLIEQPEDQKKK